MTQDVKKILQVSALVLFFGLIGAYAYYRSHDLLFGVKISGVNIVNGSTSKEKVIQVKGNAKNATNLYLDDREISVDLAGNFEETVVLLSGYNIINLKAVDKFRHRDEQYYQLIYSN